jgi:beta-phosphoglucomutase-like phosphatase (HAD superfamily)
VTLTEPQHARAIGSVRAQPAFLFDLDGTLVDSVYQHVVAWREALEEVGINLPVWTIHRRIGMSGGRASRNLSCATACSAAARRLQRQ